MARYAEAVAWIAHNDEPNDDPVTTRELVSVALVADVWGKPTMEVAYDVHREFAADFLTLTSGH